MNPNVNVVTHQPLLLDSGLHSNSETETRLSVLRPFQCFQLQPQPHVPKDTCCSCCCSSTTKYCIKSASEEPPLSLTATSKTSLNWCTCSVNFDPVLVLDSDGSTVICVGIVGDAEACGVCCGNETETGSKYNVEIRAGEGTLLGSCAIQSAWSGSKSKCVIKCWDGQRLTVTRCRNIFKGFDYLFSKECGNDGIVAEMKSKACQSTMEMVQGLSSTMKAILLGFLLMKNVLDAHAHETKLPKS